MHEILSFEIILEQWKSPVTIDTKIFIRLSIYYFFQSSESILMLFASRKASTVLNALKNKGVPAKDNGLTGPIVINEYCLLDMSNAEWGSLNSW